MVSAEKGTTTRMSKFHIQDHHDKFIVTNGSESYECASRQSAEMAVQHLNYEPGKNPCETFYHSGRWSKGEPKEAALIKHREFAR